MLEGQLGVFGVSEVEEQTASDYQNSHSTLPTLLGHKVDEYTCTGLSMRLEQVMIMVLFTQSMNIMFHV